MPTPVENSACVVPVDRNLTNRRSNEAPTRPEVRQRPHSVLDVVDRLIAISGRNLEPDIRGTGVPEAEIDRQFLDSTAIRDELGWAPKWDLDSGLRAAWDWYERTLS